MKCVRDSADVVHECLGITTYMDNMRCMAETACGEFLNDYVHDIKVFSRNAFVTCLFCLEAQRDSTSTGQQLPVGRVWPTGRAIRGH